ncbi:MAG: 50S ribosomal protein L15 [Planctomycetes bacterium]|nr:50S ribosomal protein L15 [Planctomycetota bacterium]
MRLEDILSAAGRHKRKRRVGRGRGSGRGKTSGRGSKGWGARTGSNAQLGFQGGTNPQIRRVPKRGFNNAFFARPVETVNVRDLQRAFADGDTVNAEALVAKGLIGRPDVIVKLLGDGELTHKLTVEVTRASKGAADKVAAAGGTLRCTEE